MKKNCVYCGGEFDATNDKKKFCSDSHKVMFARRKAVAEPNKIEEPKNQYPRIEELIARINKLEQKVASFMERPIDQRIFDTSKDRKFHSLDELLPQHKVHLEAERATFFGEPLIVPKRSFDMDFKPIQKNSEGFDIDEMPMWTPKPKVDKVETKAETEKFAAAEMKRLKEMQERAAMVKGKKK
jgi:hypothetical protein